MLKPTYITDPIYGTIPFDNKSDNILLELINTKEFQRLHHLKQLGFSYLVFPGAIHTRFCHSLGVVYLTKRLLNILKDREMLKLDENEYCAILCAALLHDIGHPPLSHCMEKILGINHDKMGISIIEETSLRSILDKYGLFPLLKDIFLNLIENKSYISSIVHSQLDMDRLDYLLRDSHFTGVKYGLIDLDKILHSIIIHPIPEKKSILCIQNKGYRAIEEYLLARYYMYQQVYYHKTVRGVEILLKKIIDRAQYIYLQSSKDIKIANEAIKVVLSKEKMTTEIYLQLDDPLILSHIRLWSFNKDSVLKDLCNRFLNRALFKCFSDRPVKHATDEENLDKIIADYYIKENIDFNYYYDWDSIPTFDIYNNGEKAKKEEETEQTIIYILDDDDKPIDITHFKENENILKRVANEDFKLRRRYCPSNDFKDKLLNTLGAHVK